jgi:hypothetical protein
VDKDGSQAADRSLRFCAAKIMGRPPEVAARHQWRSAPNRSGGCCRPGQQAAELDGPDLGTRRRLLVR